MGSGASQLTDQHRGRWGEVRRRGEWSDQFRIRARRARRCRGWAVWARRRRRARSARSPKETREWLISWIDKRIQYVAICLVLCLGKPCRSYSTLPVTCHPILMISLQRLLHLAWFGHVSAVIMLFTVTLKYTYFVLVWMQYIRQIICLRYLCADNSLYSSLSTSISSSTSRNAVGSRTAFPTVALLQYCLFTRRYR